MATVPLDLVSATKSQFKVFQNKTIFIVLTTSIVLIGWLKFKVCWVFVIVSECRVLWAHSIVIFGLVTGSKKIFRNSRTPQNMTSTRYRNNWGFMFDGILTISLVGFRSDLSMASEI